MPDKQKASKPLVRCGLTGFRSGYRVSETSDPKPHQKIGSKTIVAAHIRGQSGEVFGSLGPNGAGKTTTLRMLVGLMSVPVGDWCSSFNRKGILHKDAHLVLCKVFSALLSFPFGQMYYCGNQKSCCNRDDNFTR